MSQIHLTTQDVLVSNQVLAPDDTATTAAVLDDSTRLIEMLESHRTMLPFADTELHRYQSMRHELQTYQQASERARKEWRVALTQRWQYEIQGLRLYMHIYRILSDYFGADSPHLHLVATSNTSGTVTAEDLLVDLRRTYAAIVVLQNTLPQLASYITRLDETCAAIEQSITATVYWDQQRRSAIIAQRVAHDAYQRSCINTRQRIEQHLGEQSR